MNTTDIIQEALRSRLRAHGFPQARPADPDSLQRALQLMLCTFAVHKCHQRGLHILLESGEPVVAVQTNRGRFGLPSVSTRRRVRAWRPTSRKRVSVRCVDLDVAWPEWREALLGETEHQTVV